MNITNTNRREPDTDAYADVVLAGQRPGVDPVVVAHDLKVKAAAPAIGFGTLIGGDMRLFSVRTAFARLFQQIGAQIKPLMPERLKAADDVDSATDLHIGDEIFAQRSGSEAFGAGSLGPKPGAETPAGHTPNTRTDWRDTLEAMCEG